MSLGLNAILDRLVARIERSERLDPVADRAATVLARAVRAVPVRSALSGTPAGHPAHPALVTLPIGCWLAALYLDARGGSQQQDAARQLIGLGLVAAAPAVATGASDWAYTDGAERRLGFVHALTNYTGIGLFGLSWLARGRQRRAAGVAAAAAGAVALTAGGWLGGHLSYARGVGVDTTAFQVVPDEWTDVLAEQELPPDTPTLVHAGGVPVLLIRSAGTLLAIADRCTHRGAPLHEGELVDGSIVCPWHQSRFCLTDGQVCAGPATRSQPSYQVRTRYGSIQLRRADEPGSLRTNPVS